MNAQKKTSNGWPWIVVAIGAVAAFFIFRGNEPEKKSVEIPAPPAVTVTNLSVTETNKAPAQSDEDRVVALTSEGNEFLTKGDFAAAAKRFEQAITLSPDQEDLHYNLAIALAKLGKKDEAKKQYEEALRIFPEYAEALNNLGNLLMSENNLDGAIARFREALKHSPENASYHNNLGTALMRQRKTADALLEFEQAVKLSAGYVEGRVNLGNAYLSLGRVNEAIAQLEEALRLRPDFAPASQTLQRARLRQAGK